MMQQTLAGCAFCEAPPGTETWIAYTWGKEERVKPPDLRRLCDSGDAGSRRA